MATFTVDIIILIKINIIFIAIIPVSFIMIIVFCIIIRIIVSCCIIMPARKIMKIITITMKITAVIRKENIWKWRRRKRR